MMRFFIGSLIVLGCMMASLSQTAAQESTVLRVGWSGGVDDLNPCTTFNYNAFIVFEFVYDTLIQLGPDRTYQPGIAESWQVSDDGLVWTFSLRDDLSFHNGKALTAEDVVYTYTYYQTNYEDCWAPADYTTFFDTIEAPDDQTVVLTLTDPIANLESKLVFLRIFPAPEANETPDVMVGSGPFEVVEHNPGGLLRLAANSDYPTSAPFDELTFDVFTNDDIKVQALRTGQLDLVSDWPETLVEMPLADNMVVVTGTQLLPGVDLVAINQIAPEQCASIEDATCTGHPALRDPVVRQALAYATNKPQLLDIVLANVGTPGLTLLPDALTPWYHTELTDYAFNLERARQLLDDAGYIDQDGNGIREMPDGETPLAFRLFWDELNLLGPPLAQLLVQNWEQIGLTIVEPQPTDLFGSISAFDYDLALSSWASDPDPDFILSLMTSASIEAGWNETGYANPMYDDLYIEQRLTRDETERQALIWQMQEIVHADVVYIALNNNLIPQAYQMDCFSGWPTDTTAIALEHPDVLLSLQPEACER